MPSLQGLSAALGGAMLGVLRVAQHRKLAVRRGAHRDRRGRVTPYLELGRARRGTLLWLHGFSDRPDTFLATAGQLHDDFRVIAPALPGFHEGWVDRSAPHTWETYADWIEELASSVIGAGERFHVMGSSLGGAVALALASRMPDRVASVVPVNSAGVRLAGVRCISSELEEGANLFEVRSEDDYARFVRRIFSGPVKVPRPIADHLYRDLRKNADWYDRLMRDLVASAAITEEAQGSEHVDLGAIRVPALVVWGEHDSLFPLAHGRHVAETLPDAELLVIERCGHCPHLERPSALARGFREFAARVDAREGGARAVAHRAPRSGVAPAAREDDPAGAPSRRG